MLGAVDARGKGDPRLGEWTI